MLKSLVLSGLLASGVGAFASTPFDNQPLYSPTTQAVVYDDTTYKISFSYQEMQDYTWNNLFNYFDSESSLSMMTAVSVYGDDAYVMYSSQVIDEANYTAEDPDEQYVYWEADEHFSQFQLNRTTSSVLCDIQDGSFIEFVSVSITIANNDYQSFKSAIELDIQANQPQPHSAGFISALFSFVTLLTSGVVTLATGIASGVVGMAKALFLNSTATGLSIFGGLIAMFAGIALAVTLTTKVYQWITSLGN